MIYTIQMTAIIAKRIIVPEIYELCIESNADAYIRKRMCLYLTLRQVKRATLWNGITLASTQETTTGKPFAIWMRNPNSSYCVHQKCDDGENGVEKDVRLYDE